MNQINKTKDSDTLSDEAPVIDLPKNYRGQKLTGDTIKVSPKYARTSAQHRQVLLFLMKQFAAEMGCGKTARSKRYLQGLNSGQGYFWIHDDFPDIAFVSLAQSENGSVDRLLLVMPHKDMIQEFFVPKKSKPKSSPASSVETTQRLQDMHEPETTIH